MQHSDLLTLIKTTSTALSPLAHKLYLRLYRSYIFPTQARRNCDTEQSLFPTWGPDRHDLHGSSVWKNETLL